MDGWVGGGKRVKQNLARDTLTENKTLVNTAAPNIPQGI